jgi:glycerol uptake facilitator-like aquaporin
MTAYSDQRRVGAEFIGTAMLLATVVGSGIMAEQLAGGNVAVALLGNTIPTGAILVVLITLLGPVSGAHFNPVVTGVFALKGELARGLAVRYVVAQIVGGIVGVLIAHAMFDLPLLQLSTKVRTGSGQWVSEIVATFGLIFVILGGLRSRPDAIPVLVGLYITAAYWFTASTSFANPAVTLARSFSNTFAGISLAHAPGFMVAQIIGAGLGWALGSWLFAEKSP